MPASSKRRKNGKTKKSGPSYHLHICPELVDVFRDVYRRAEMAVEYNLPTGNIGKDDIRFICDMFNLGTVGLISRSWLDQEEVDAFEPEFIAAKNALGTFIKRGHTTNRWVCTGDELRLIRDVVVTLGAFIQDSLDTHPRRFVLEFMAMDELTSVVGNQGVLDKKMIDRAIKRYSNGNTLKQRMREILNAQKVRNEDCKLVA